MDNYEQFHVKLFYNLTNYIALALFIYVTSTKLANLRYIGQRNDAPKNDSKENLSIIINRVDLKEYNMLRT